MLDYLLRLAGKTTIKRHGSIHILIVEITRLSSAPPPLCKIVVAATFCSTFPSTSAQNLCPSRGPAPTFNNYCHRFCRHWLPVELFSPTSPPPPLALALASLSSLPISPQSAAFSTSPSPLFSDPSLFKSITSAFAREESTDTNVSSSSKSTRICNSAQPKDADVDTFKVTRALSHAATPSSGYHNLCFPTFRGK
jgi:hypothetical protein